MRGIEETEPPQETEPSLPVTPPNQGEERCGAVEGKAIRAQQLPHSLTLHLQANMMQLCGKTLERIAVKPGDASH